MKFGYDPDKIARYFDRIYVEDWLKNGWISASTKDRLLNVLQPAYRHTNLFIGIGLFLLTVVIINASIGMFMLFLVDVFSQFEEWIVALIISVVLFFSLQKVIITNNNYFRSGADNATLYAAVSSLYLAIYFLMENTFLLENNYLSLLVFVIAGVTAMIYKDRFAELVSLGALYAFIFFQLYRWGDLATLFIPFVLMALSAVLWLYAKKNCASSKSEVDEQCWLYMKWWGSAFFYLSGNIFVVTELSNELGLADAFPEPVRWFFYVFTVALPILFVGYGLKHRQLALLNIGLGAIALAIFSIYYYQPVIEEEYLFLILGIILLVIAWVALKFTSKLSWNITSEKTTDRGIQLESLIIMETFGSSEQQDQEFGGQGGSFSGGGATGNF